MTSKSFFLNEYGDYSIENATFLLNDSKDAAISEEFFMKLQRFKKEKLHLLSTSMEKDIFGGGTVYTGSAGLSMYYFMSAISKNEVNEQLLKKATEYINLNNLNGKRISFLCGDAGPLVLATVLAYKLGTKRPENLPDHKILVQRLLSLISMLEVSPDELLYGKVGYLYALLFVKKYINDEKSIPSSHIEKVVTSIIKSGKKLATEMKSKSPLLWQWHDKVYFGAAHGMAGILYMLLQAREHINVDDIRCYIKPTIDWLLNQQFDSGNFPSSLNSSSGDRLVQWCHGAPGFIPLCVIAHQVFNEEKYLKIALQCGEVIWQRGLTKKGYSICHGVSGNAYAFIQLYQATKEPIHFYRACCFMEWCLVERPGTELHRPDRPASLFEGLVGRLYLAEDITRVLDAKFPGFCL